MPGLSRPSTTPSTTPAVAQAPPAQAPVQAPALGAQTSNSEAVADLGLDAEGGEEAMTPDQQALADLFVHGAFGPMDIVAPLSGTAGESGLGGFAVAYDPLMDLLTVTLACNVNFLDGMTISGGAIVADPGAPDLAPTAVMLNTAHPDAAGRAQVVADHFHWTDQADWLFEFENSIETVWSFAHQIRNTRPGWEEVGVDVSVDVVATQGGSGGHSTINVFKVPDPNELFLSAAPASGVGPATQTPIQQGASVHSGGTTGMTEDASARNNAMTLSSTGVAPRADNLLRLTAYFAQDSAALTADATGNLDTAIQRYRDAGQASMPPVRLEGHASAEGGRAHNAALTDRRLNAVSAHLRAGGLTHIDARVSEDNRGETGALANDERFRRVDVICDEGMAQTVSAHEAGHLFGLGDEYTNQGIGGTGQAAGTAAPHDQLAQDAGGVGAVHENNSNIMSLGDRVAPQHYATFVFGLKQLTSETNWVCR